MSDFWKLFLCLSNCTGNRYICVFNYVVIWQTNIVWLIGRITYDWLPTVSQWNVFIVTNVENEDKYLYNPGAVFNRFRLCVRQIDLFLFVLWRYSSSFVRFLYFFLYLNVFEIVNCISNTSHHIQTYRGSFSTSLARASGLQSHVPLSHTSEYWVHGNSRALRPIVHVLAHVHWLGEC